MTIEPAALTGQQLIALAKERTRAGRRELFENIADLFMLERSRLSDRERSLLTGILGNLIGTVERQVRRALSERFKNEADAPSELIYLLASEEIEIARPILMESPVLREPELIRLIGERGREHWLAISGRRSLSAQVSDEIIATGDTDVIETLLNNPNAELSQNAMDYLVAEAERVDRFQRPLLQRSDLPPALAIKMYWWVSAALRRYILRRFDFAEARLDELVEDATLGAIDAQPSPARSMDDVARRLIDRLSQVQPITPNLLINFLRAGRVPVFIVGFARFSNVPEPVIRRVTLDADGESLAILCRASEVARNEFASLFLLIQSIDQGLRAVQPQRLNTILEFFDAMTRDNARAVIRYWSRQSAFIEAIDQVSASGRGSGSLGGRLR